MPTTATVELTYLITGAPATLPVQSNGISLSLDPNPPLGQYNLKLTATDQVSSLSTTLDISLLIYSCKSAAIQTTTTLTDMQLIAIRGTNPQQTFTFTTDVEQTYPSVDCKLTASLAPISAFVSLTTIKNV